MALEERDVCVRLMPRQVLNFLSELLTAPITDLSPESALV